MTDNPPAPLALQLVETGPEGGWCDVETGICTTTAADQEGPLPASDTAGDR